MEAWVRKVRDVMGEMDAGTDRGLAALAVSRGLLTPEQSRLALDELEEAERGGRRVRLREIFSRRGWLSATQVAGLLEEQAQRALATDRYEILGELGRGAMAVVYRARDRSLGREVALKVLRHEYAGHQAAVSRMIREARAIASLNHPNIVRLHDLSEEVPPYLVMELVKGRTLAQALAAGGWPLRARLEALEQVARALDAAHRQGIVHRDLKPENVMIDGAGRAVVMDFGLAHLASSASRLTRSGAVLGTPLYMAPEQVRGESRRIDGRTDVYALGVILYEMLAGRVPFTGPAAPETYDRILRSEPAPPGRGRKGVAPDLETISLKALEKDAAHRYATAAAFADDLRRFLEGRPIQARPVPSWARAGRALRRHRAAFFAAAAVVAAAAAGAIGLSLQADRSDRELSAMLDHSRRREVSLQRLSTHWSTIVDRKRELRQLKSSPADARRELAAAVGAVEAHLRDWPDDPRGYYVRARGRMYLGDLRRAEEDLRLALAKEPAFRPGWSLLGIVKVEELQEGLYGLEEITPKSLARLGPGLEEAVEAFRRGWGEGRAREESARWGLAWTREDQVMERIARAVAILMGGGKEAEVLRPLEEGLAEYRAEEYAFWQAMLRPRLEDKKAWLSRAIEWAPGYALACFARAGALQMLGDRKGALADLTRAIEIQEDYVIAYNNRGSLRHSLGDLAGAISDFDRALDLQPAFPAAFSNRGAARQSKGDLAGAIFDFDRATELDPRCFGAFVNRGNARSENGEFDRAVADYDRALEIRKDIPEAHFGRGRARRERGEIAGALADLDRAVELRPSHAEAWYWRARCHHQNRDLDRALADYDRALALRAEFPEALNDRGETRAGKGDRAGALADFDRAIGLSPEFAIAHYNRGNLRVETGDLQAAIRDYDRCLELKKDFSSGYNGRAIAKRRLGDLRGAVADYDRAIELEKDFPEALGSRGALKEALGDRPGAVRDFDAALRSAPADWPHRKKIEALRDRAAGGK